MPEEVLFADEQHRTRTDVADYLRTVADRLDDGGVAGAGDEDDAAEEPTTNDTTEEPTANDADEEDPTADAHAESSVALVAAGPHSLVDALERVVDRVETAAPAVG